MKRPERVRLVANIRGQIAQMAPHQKVLFATALLKQAADVIEQLEKELDAIHENFLKGSEQ